MRKSTVQLANSLFQGSQLRLDPTPPLTHRHHRTSSNASLREVSREAQAATSIERKFFNGETKAGGLLNSSNRGKLVLGYSTSGNEPVTITFSRRSDSNLLIIGKEEEAALDLLTIAMLDRATYHPPAHIQFYAIDLSLENAIESIQAPLLSSSGNHSLTIFHALWSSCEGCVMSVPRLLTAISDELEEREDGSGTTTTLYLFFHGLQFAEKLLQKGPVLGENTVSRDAAQNFSYIARKGSRMDIHTLIWSDKCNSLKQALAMRHYITSIIASLSRCLPGKMWPKCWSDLKPVHLVRNKLFSSVVTRMDLKNFVLTASHLRLVTVSHCQNSTARFLVTGLIFL